MCIKVISIFEKQTDPDGIYVNTTSKADNWERDLSPFYLGPCQAWDGRVAQRHENLWQYLKIYAGYWNDNGYPDTGWFTWSNQGFTSEKAVRYPMGKGRKPLGSWYNNQLIGYIEARKKIYAPSYIQAVANTRGFHKLVELSNSGRTIYLRDYDAYRHEDLGMTLSDVLNYPNKKMGHAFVLAMLLKKDSALKELTFS